MLCCVLTLTTILLASLGLANQTGALEDDVLSRARATPIYSSLAFHDRLPSFWVEHTYDSVDNLDDDARQTWLYRDHVTDRHSDHLADLEPDEQKADSIELQSLALRDAKGAKHDRAKPAKESKAEKKAEANAAKADKKAKDEAAKASKKTQDQEKKSKDHAAKAAKTAQENTAKANKKSQDQAKKTKDNTAKADKKAKNEAAKADKQKQKDQKLVKDNLALEKKAQNKAGVTAQKKLDSIQKKSQKDNANENKKFQNQQKKLEQNLSKAQGDVGKQKGKKSERKAAQNLAKAKAAVANLPDQHKAKINKLYKQAMGSVAKDKASLDKSLTKAHTDQFDASGKAKAHKSIWAKIGTVMSYLGPAMLSFIPGVGSAIMGAMTAGRAASAAVQAGVKEGVKNGVKTGTKQGTKETEKSQKKAASLGWKKQGTDQIQVSQKNKDSHINAFEQKSQQMALALKPQKRDIEEDILVDRLTPRRIYNSARNILFEDMIWDDWDEQSRIPQAPESFAKADGDRNAYRIGKIGRHLVVPAHLSGMDKVVAAASTNSIYATFRKIALATIVGVREGAPRMPDFNIQLGDVVVGILIF